MYKIIGSRACGKTCSLMQKAQYILDECPNKTIAFICKQPDIIKEKYIKEGFEQDNRIIFISFKDGLTIDADYKLIDELDEFLKEYNIWGYSISTASDDYSFLEV